MATTLIFFSLDLKKRKFYVAQLAEAKDYTDRIYADGQTPSNEYPRYDAEQSDGVAPVLELWEIWNTPLMPLFPGPL